MDDRPLERGRAWIEVELNALAHNLSDIRSKIPVGCQIMAIVKANAYGHGVKRIAEQMVKEGIEAYAVATVTEGIELREHVPEGSILVLGRTPPDDAKWLFNNKLSQLVMDGAYAKSLNETGYKLNIHIAIDTGMHRLGMEPSNLDEIKSIYDYDNLIIEGIGTHLSSPDSLTKSDVDFTNQQIEKLTEVVNVLKEKGHNTGKLHAQSSYGIYNYPGLKFDYVRPGIMMYGVKSLDDETKIKTDLRPVLSLKAVISQVRWIEAGESVSYGRMYTTGKPAKIATVGIGYADGLPRQMSNNGGKAIVKGRKVPIIGRICMDMLMLNVTEIQHVEAGDIVTLIGKDGDEVIHCEDIAGAANTITNDVLSGLSGRLPRIYI